jgi:hypothetical protein
MNYYNRDRGMRWQEIKDMSFYRLAEARAYYTDPRMEDAYDDHDGTIDVYFGSTGSTITLRLTDGEAVGLFAYGYCGILAYAIHMKTGLPLIVFTSDVDNLDGWSGHAGVRVGEDQILDITGINSEQEILGRYRSSKLSAGVIMEENKFVKLTFAKENHADPLGFVEELEQYVTNDFADWLIETNNVKVPALA